MNKLLTKGKLSWMLSMLSAVLVLGLASCGDDEVTPPSGTDAVASFQFAADASDFLTINFTNFSQNATTYSWDFGDGSSSTLESPSHTYAVADTYTVVLTATGATNVASTKSETVTINDPLAAQRALIGDAGKTWQLIADVSTGSHPYEVGPADRSQIWWALGINEEICVRECVMDDTWTFNTDGTFTFENNGDFWGEGGIWEDGTNCFDATAAGSFTGKDSQDLSDWDSGTHGFTFDAGTGDLVITGGFLGLTKVGSTAEFTAPQTSVAYKVVKLVDADVDTLTIETVLTDAVGYWSFTFVSYDNPADAVVTTDCAPVTEVNVTFKMNWNDYAGTATTPYLSGQFAQQWCGDCAVMTDDNSDGIYEITMAVPANSDIQYKFTADNWADQEAFAGGESCTVPDGDFVNRIINVGASDMSVGPFCWNSCEDCPTAFTAADLVGSWKVAAEEGAIGVGPGSGDISWWFLNKDGDDVTARACWLDDVYTFGGDASFAIQMDGSTWVEGWQAGGNACETPVAPHDGSATTYTYEATDTTVKLNGVGAFLAVPKAFNGGELSDPANAPADVTYTVTGYSVAGDGTKRLTVEVDISGAQDGTAYWTYVLVSQ